MDVQINSLGKRVWKETFTYMVNLLSNMLKQVNEEGIVSLVLLQLVYRYMQKKNQQYFTSYHIKIIQNGSQTKMLEP